MMLTIAGVALWSGGAMLAVCSFPRQRVFIFAISVACIGVGLMILGVLGGLL